MNISPLSSVPVAALAREGDANTNIFSFPLDSAPVGALTPEEDSARQPERESADLAAAASESRDWLGMVESGSSLALAEAEADSRDSWLSEAGVRLWVDPRREGALGDGVRAEEPGETAADGNDVGVRHGFGKWGRESVWGEGIWW